MKNNSLLLILLFTAASLSAQGTRLLRQPTLSSDKIVFVHADDLWIVDRTGGDAQRLTSNEGSESNPHFSPDEKQIAFTAQYDGNTDVYIIPVEEGNPKRLTFHPGSDVVQGWTPAGKVLSLLLSACSIDADSHSQDEAQGWQLVFKNDETGAVLHGNKEALISAVRKGYPLRIGFGSRRQSDITKSVEHLADGKFLTIANGKDIFAQIEPIIGQGPDLDSDTLSITFRENLQWTIIVGTNGFSDRLMIDRFQDTIRGHNSRPTAVSWYVDYPSTRNAGDLDAEPLW